MSDNTTDRRKFLLGAAGVASTALLAPSLSLRQADAAAMQTAPVKADFFERSDLKITADDVKAAEKLLDVQYTNNERQQILQTIEGQLESIRTIRAYSLPNDLAPAQVFNPRLPGKSYPTQKNSVNLSDDPLPDLPSNEEDIAFAPLTHLAYWLKERRISSLELTDIYLKRIALHGEKLLCFVTVTADLARAEARRADQELARGQYRGPLHGVPYGLKDLMDTKGIKTTWGAGPYKERVAQTDAIIVSRLREAGAVLIGKTTCGALAFGDIWFGGKTKNPWNLEEGSSGSSAGSASATAAGLCGFAIGTETLGSIISPSQRCGTAGLRPTFGRIARTGTMALCWSLGKIGAICRSVEDTALVLAAINGGHVSDPSSSTTPFYYDGNRDPWELTVGFDSKWFDQNATDVDIKTFEIARTLGFKLKEVKSPRIKYSAMVQNLVAEAAAAFEELTLSNKDDLLSWQEPRAWPNSFRMARFMSAVDYINLDRLRRRAMVEIDQMFEGVDAIIGPNYAGSMLTATNYTGQPQLTFRAGFRSVPTRKGFSSDPEPGASAVLNRVTHNFSVWAPLYQEHNALIVGNALEKAMGVYMERPRL